MRYRIVFKREDVEEVECEASTPEGAGAIADYILSTTYEGEDWWVAEINEEAEPSS